ncbi:MAG: BREX system ATP-binding protein BrxD [Rubrobacter sp.]
MALNRRSARDIVDALRNGTVPRSGLHEYAVGLGQHMQAMEEQLDRVASGRGDVRSGRGEIKFVRGEYGAGKTFLTHLLVETALKKGFVVSNVIISKDTPLHKLDEVYREIVTNLSTPREKTGALKGLLDRWTHRIEESLIRNEDIEENDPRLERRTEEEIEERLAIIAQEHSAFSAVLRAYYRADISGDSALAQHLLGWLRGEKGVAAHIVRQAAGVKGKIDQTMIFAFIRILAEISHQAGRAGFVVVLDEVETITRLRTAKESEQGLQNIRQIVDAVDEGHLSRCYFVFTGTPDFFDNRNRGVRGLQPLDDRIRLDDPNDQFPNYRQAQVAIQPFDREKLLTVGKRVKDIYEVAYGSLDGSRASDATVESLADQMTARFGGEVKVVPRQFLRQLVDTFDRIQAYEEYEPLGRIDEDLSRSLSAAHLTDVENAYVAM